MSDDWHPTRVKEPDPAADSFIIVTTNTRPGLDKQLDDGTGTVPTGQYANFGASYRQGIGQE